MKISTRIVKRILTATACMLSANIAYAAPGLSYLGKVPSGEPAQVKSILSNTCSACHGADGNSLMTQYPNLAGQNESYLVKQLDNFHTGARSNQIMQAMVATIPADHFAQDVEDLAYYFSQQKFNPKINANATEPKTTLKILKIGEQIYRSGLPTAGVPACMACHEADGMGNGPMAIPRLAGQHSAYVITQLLQFRDGERHNDPHEMMRMIAGRLSKKEITAVAFYVQALRPNLILGDGPKNYEQTQKQGQPTPLIGVPTDQIAAPAAEKTAASTTSSPKL
ncbi:c-type cytochrome [Acidihalobacter yilgarnensis]|nr:c-type cytochrome [Acidihalobacter yilgarnensis]